MAKEIRETIRLFSSSNNGHYYSTTKNKRTNPEKIKLKKFDPFIQKHVIYIEKKSN
ncbi:50S ribosomal protein L33 [Candidatus Blochmannia vicinus]|uniref:Large ribosomal subunit protein bL33 n=1 Tax=Candidatus Blochmannia vicinus (nom. nud.) TaxID=251540 RepID=A0A9Q8TW09_9ENTR|nr:50S ribosomal protein L33 [Candidatus Blochmannia vicinus]URJ28179.1 50S ribosomal protein L33 [Candidatus Blochmannia vicinus]URJ30544.1 50S ribosomal protein L33 [Candidatus Blochmannia vicinus]URJ33248.1 50S ribosomal protein L33 [Candidatus Blochmannia vicinus]